MADKDTTLVYARRAYDSAQKKFEDALDAGIGGDDLQVLRTAKNDAYDHLCEVRTNWLTPADFPINTYLAKLKEANDAVDSEAITVANVETVSKVIVQMVDIAGKIAAAVAVIAAG